MWFGKGEISSYGSNLTNPDIGNVCLHLNKGREGLLELSGVFESLEKP